MSNRPLERIVRYQNALFRDVPADTCAWLRILFGCLGLVQLAGLTPVSMYWALDGLVPVAGGGAGVRSLLIRSELSSVAGWTFWVAMVVGLSLFTIGYRSRLMNAVCFMGVVAQGYWNHLPLSMAWQVQACVLYLLLFTNSGGVLSADAWIARRSGKTGATTTPMWPLLVLRYQVALVYLSSGLWKLVGTSWRDGSALHYILSNHVFARFPGAMTPALEPLATFATYTTLLWELAFPLMVLHRPTRWIALVIGVAIHLGIWVTLEVGTFSWMMMATYVVFVDPSRAPLVTQAMLRGWSSVRGDHDAAALSA